MALSRPQILVLRALGLGDLLTGVPALRALRRTFPAHEIVLAAPRQLTPLLALTGAVDRVHEVRDLHSALWAGPPPEVAVNLHGSGPESHRLLRQSRPGRLVAFACSEADHAGPRWDPDEHEVRRWCRLLEEGLRIDTDPGDLALPRPATASAVPGAVVVHPGAAFAARRWPAERFAAVARRVADDGEPVVITGGPEEVSLAEEVRGLAGLPPECALAGRTDLSQLAAQVAQAALVVCGDTGVAHLASAFSTPSVLLFGPTPPSRWGPPQDGPHTVIWHGRRGGDPWADQVDPALLAIGVDEVVTAVRRRLAAPRTTPASS